MKAMDATRFGDEWVVWIEHPLLIEAERRYRAWERAAHREKLLETLAEGDLLADLGSLTEALEAAGQALEPDQSGAGGAEAEAPGAGPMAEALEGCRLGFGRFQPGNAVVMANAERVCDGIEQLYEVVAEALAAWHRQLAETVDPRLAAVPLGPEAEDREAVVFHLTEIHLSPYTNQAIAVASAFLTEDIQVSLDLEGMIATGVTYEFAEDDDEDEDDADDDDW